MAQHGDACYANGFGTQRNAPVIVMYKTLQNCAAASQSFRNRLRRSSRAAHSVEMAVGLMQEFLEPVGLANAPVHHVGEHALGFDLGGVDMMGVTLRWRLHWKVLSVYCIQGYMDMTSGRFTTFLRGEPPPSSV